MNIISKDSREHSAVSPHHAILSLHTRSNVLLSHVYVTLVPMLYTTSSVVLTTPMVIFANGISGGGEQLKGSSESEHKI